MTIKTIFEILFTTPIGITIDIAMVSLLVMQFISDLHEGRRHTDARCKRIRNRSKRGM